MSKIVKPDYENSILNITGSLFNYYDVPSKYKGIKELNDAFKKKYKNVVMMVFDGMGIDIIQKHLDENSFLRQNIAKTITSVYPCTTTAAMTSYYTGLSPFEHGWLGWSLYFKEFGRTIDIFMNEDSYTKEVVSEIHASYALMPYETAYEKIKKNNAIETYTIMPIGVKFPDVIKNQQNVDSVEKLCEKIKETADKEGEKFIFSYWHNPDGAMHQLGCDNIYVKDILREIDSRTKALADKLEDTLLIISADHGHLDINETIDLAKYPDVMDCLIIPPFIEPRCLSFFVKEDKKKEFKECFESYFSEDYVLYTKKAFIEEGFMGDYGNRHGKVDDFLGDYMACAVGDKIIKYKTLNYAKEMEYKGHHAGLTDKEMLVPLIIVN